MKCFCDCVDFAVVNKIKKGNIVSAFTNFNIGSPSNFNTFIVQIHKVPKQRAFDFEMPIYLQEMGKWEWLDHSRNYEERVVA